MRVVLLIAMRIFSWVGYNRWGGSECVGVNTRVDTFDIVLEVGSDIVDEDNWEL